MGGLFLGSGVDARERLIVKDVVVATVLERIVAKMKHYKIAQSLSR
jgi:hypothetical protein